MVEIKNQTQLKQISEKLNDLQRECQECLSLADDSEIGTENDIYGQLSDVISNIETLIELAE